MAIKIPWKISIIVIGIVRLVSAGIIIPVVIYQQNPSIQGIEITSDEDFLKYDLSGTGTENNPYIIEDFYIKPKSNDNGISVSSVTKYFTIRNCIIEKPDKNTESFIGINIENLPYKIAKISNNTLLKGDYGIRIFNSDGVIIFNNYLYNCSIGIGVTDDSYGCRIRSNTIENGVVGIHLDDAQSSHVEDNECKFSSYTGISVVSSGYSDFIRNNLIGTGFSFYLQFLEYSLSSNIENNLVNGKEFGFLSNLTNQTISSDEFGQLVLLNCSKIILEDLEIRDTSTALTLFFCRNSTIRNSSFSENTLLGISLRYSTEILSFNNNCSDNMNSYKSSYYHGSSSGISIWKCTFVDVQSCTILRNGHNGIFTYGGDNCSITYNSIEENGGHGLFLYYSFFNVIHHNSFVDNVQNFDANSQAYELDSADNVFYEESTNLGNYWNDWSGTSVYDIGGSSETTNSDLFPLSSPPI